MQSQEKVTDEAAPTGVAHVWRRSPVRGTQSLVYTMAACWKRPGLTALEIAWRWTFGLPVLLLLLQEGRRIFAATPLDWGALRGMSFLDPMGASVVLAKALAQLGPPVWGVGIWLAPLLGVLWVLVSAVGRGVVVRRVDPRAHARVGTLIVLHALRLAALVGSFAVWFAGVHWAANAAVTGPIAAGQEPNLVLYFAMAIVATLGMFSVWALVSWGLSEAPLVAMLLDLGPAASIAATFRAGAVRGKLIEINLVMGIVKIALIVLAMVFSATPLPFESVATPGFMMWWYAVVGILYLVASDYFHIVRLVAYVEMWRLFAEER